MQLWSTSCDRQNLHNPSLPPPPQHPDLVRLQVPESFIRERMNSIDIGRGVDIPYMEEALAVILGER